MRTTEVIADPVATGVDMNDMMKALVYGGPGQRTWQSKPKPVVRDPGDAVVRITTTTICGTDLHILKGDVPTITAGRILGHEGIGVGRGRGSARVDVSHRRPCAHLVYQRVRDM